MKKIYTFLFNGFSDWEIAYLSPEINKNENFELIYFSKGSHSITSMGGLRVKPDLALEEIDIGEMDMLILPGGTAWEKDDNNKVEHLVKNQFATGKDIAAICAATTYLGRLGILDNLNHTSNDLNYLKSISPNYLGQEKYINALAVTDQNLITANGIAPIDFAREIFTKIKLFDADNIEKWYQLFKNGIWPDK